jgi:hypothetical protein
MVYLKPGDQKVLAFLKADGTEVAVPETDPFTFATLSRTLSAQQDAARINTAREAAYVNAVNAWNASISIGRTPAIPLPVKPLMHVVSDPVWAPAWGTWSDGVPSDVPFNHALPDPLMSSVQPGEVSQPSTPFNSTAGTSADPLYQILMGLTILNAKLDKLIGGTK